MGSRSQNWMAGAIRNMMKERQLQITRSVVSLPIPATVAKRQVSFAETMVIHVPFENEGRKPSNSRKHCMTELPAMEQIQEQIVESIKEGPQERVQQRTVDQNVRAPVPTVQEQRFVSEIPRAQVVKRIEGNVVETIPQDRLKQRTLEHNMRLPVPTVQEQLFVPRIQGAQVVEQIQDHIVESIDQDLIDELRHDWLVGAFEPENDEDEDGRRERKPSRMETVNRTRLKHPVFQ